MKRLLLSTVISAFIFSSCGNDTKVKEVKKNEDGTTTTTSYDVDDAKKMANTGNEIQKKMENLKKLAPLTMDQLKTLLPEELSGMKRSDLKTTSAMGYAVAEAKYKKDEDEELKAMVYDCAGTAGSTLYMGTYMGAMNFQQESEKEYTKTINFKGGKAVEKYEKDRNRSTLTYVSNDRLLVVLEGKNMDPAALKATAEDLNFSL